MYTGDLDEQVFGQRAVGCSKRDVRVLAAPARYRIPTARRQTRLHNVRKSSRNTRDLQPSPAHRQHPAPGTSDAESSRRLFRCNAPRYYRPPFINTFFDPAKSSSARPPERVRIQSEWVLVVNRTKWLISLESAWSAWAVERDSDMNAVVVEALQEYLREQHAH